MQLKKLYVSLAFATSLIFSSSVFAAPEAEKKVPEYKTAVELSTAAAKVNQEFKEGENYKIIEGAQLTPNKEVREYFSYFCGHCHAFLPVITMVRDALPDDTEFVSNPVHYLGGPMGPELQKAYAAALTLNIADQLTARLDDDIFNKNKIPQTHDDVVKIVEELGVPAHTFEAQYKSFPVASMAAQYLQETEDSKITGVPSVTVNGKYLILPKGIKDNAVYLSLVNYLLNLDKDSYKDGKLVTESADK